MAENPRESFINRRLHRRYSRRIPALYGHGTPRHPGFIRDLSSGGAKINGRILYQPQTSLVVEIQDPQQTVRVVGQVMRVEHPDAVRVGQGQFPAMGIQLVDHGPDYLELLDRIIKEINEMEERREHPRYDKIFKVQFETPERLVEEYTRNISLGGLFIATESPPPLNTVVEVNLMLYEIMQNVRAEVRVVNIITPELAEKIGMPAGIGVQFERFMDDGHRILQEYVEEFRRFAK